MYCSIGQQKTIQTTIVKYKVLYNRDSEVYRFLSIHFSQKYKNQKTMCVTNLCYG